MADAEELTLCKCGHGPETHWPDHYPYPCDSSNCPCRGFRPAEAAKAVSELCDICGKGISPEFPTEFECKGLREHDTPTSRTKEAK